MTLSSSALPTHLKQLDFEDAVKHEDHGVVVVNPSTLKLPELSKKTILQEAVGMQNGRFLAMIHSLRLLLPRTPSLIVKTDSIEWRNEEIVIVNVFLKDPLLVAKMDMLISIVLSIATTKKEVD